MYTITQEQRDRYNANRRLKKQQESQEEREARLSRRRDYEKRRRVEGGEQLRRRTRELALAYVTKQRDINPNYEAERYRKSKIKKERLAAERNKLVTDSTKLCPRCLFIRDKQDFPMTRSGERANVCSRCYKILTGSYDIQSDRFWASKANAVLQRAKRRRSSCPISKITGDELRSIYETQLHKCIYCGIPLTALIVAVDHKIPLSRGGSHTLDNIQLVCHNCNISKFTMTDAEYRSFIL